MAPAVVYTLRLDGVEFGVMGVEKPLACMWILVGLFSVSAPELPVCPIPAETVPDCMVPLVRTRLKVGFTTRTVACALGVPLPRMSPPLETSGEEGMTAADSGERRIPPPEAGLPSSPTLLGEEVGICTWWWKDVDT